MAGSSRSQLPPSVDFDGGPSARATGAPSPDSPRRRPTDFRLSYGERAASASGAAFLSAILVNPLDVAKTRLQAQAAGVSFYTNHQSVGMRTASLGSSTAGFPAIRCRPPSEHGGSMHIRTVRPPNCLEYKGTLDVLNKIIREEGFARLWRGTNAGMAVAIPTVGIYLPCYDVFRNWMEDFAAKNAPVLTPYAPLAAGAVARSLACIACSPIELARTRMQAFKELRSEAKLPGIRETLIGVFSPPNHPRIQSYRIFWIGLGAQLSRDVPFSAICWCTLEPIRRNLLGLVGDGSNPLCVLGANFAAGFASGSFAAALTCPLDVAKTRRQIEEDVTRALKMTTRGTLLDAWRDHGVKGLFVGLGPRVSRTGPSVGLVVSFYEVVKYALHRRNPCF